MSPSARLWAWALCVGLGAAASAGAEPPAPPSPCDARVLGEAALREYEAGVAALKRDAREAVAPLRRALELEPGAAVVRMVLGSALAKAGQPEAAAPEYAAFVSACPQHPRAEQIRHLLADYARARAQPAAPVESPVQVTLTAPGGAASAPLASPQRALCDVKQLLRARARALPGGRAAAQGGPLRRGGADAGGDVGAGAQRGGGPTAAGHHVRAAGGGGRRGEGVCLLRRGVPGAPEGAHGAQAAGRVPTRPLRPVSSLERAPRRDGVR